MPYIGGFFAFLIFMAVMESYGLISYVYAAFWLIVIGGICFALFRVYREEVLRFIRSRRSQGGFAFPRIQPHAIAFIREIKTQFPNFRFQRELGVLLTVIGVLIFLNQLFGIQHVGNGWGFTKWLFWLLALPCILLVIGSMLTAWAKSIENALASELYTERVGEASKLYQEKELRIVEQARADIDAYMPPPGPFEVFTADIFPRERMGRILNPLIDLNREWSTALPNCDRPLFSLDEKTNQDEMTVQEIARDLIALPSISVELLHWRQMGFSDADRFRHQFIVGNTGSGKTTYLSVQIKEDLQREARGECSLFVMDSKNELIPNIAKLNDFAKGGWLENSLTYIEPNPEYPIALNIFESSISPSLKESRQAQQSALQLIDFFLSSILQMDATGHQETLLRYAVPAVLAVPGATLQTLKELLDEGGFEKFEPHFRHLRQAEWLKANLHSKSSFNITRHALRGRIESMLADDTFHDLFCKPRSTLDLSAQLNEPRVVLVNTLKGELPVTAGPFGCFFIAKLLQLTEQRTLQRGSKLPVFVYIDEASDYLANNAAVIEIVNKARAQNISFTFAIQGVEDVSPEVLAALRRCNIQAFNGTGQGGTFDIAMSNRPPVTVRVPKFNFATSPHISEKTFERLQRQMWETFTYRKPNENKAVSVFELLKIYDPALAELGIHAEQGLAVSPNIGCAALRIWLEALLRMLETEYSLLPIVGSNFIEQNIDRLADKGIITGRVKNHFHFVRKNGNKAVHGTIEPAMARATFQAAYRICDWLLAKHAPKPPANSVHLAKLERELTTLLGEDSTEPAKY